MPRVAKKGPTGTQKKLNLFQKLADWSPEEVQNDPQIGLKTCLKFGRFPRSILRAFLMDFRVDSDGKKSENNGEVIKIKVFAL